MSVKAGEGRGEHGSIAQTERITYDRLRTSGMSRDEARRMSREAAEATHRTLDRGPRRKE